MTFNKKTIENAKEFAGLCSNCRLPNRLCFCAELAIRDCPVGITLLVQWSEYWRVSNTGRWTNLILSNSEIIIRGDPDGVPLDYHSPDPGQTNLFLYPGPGVELLTPELATSLPENSRLYLPDGTWNEANKIARKAQFLRTMRRVQLPPGLPSRYGLRRNGRPNCVCTVEAVAHALRIFGHVETSDYLLLILSKLVTALTSIRPSSRQRRTAGAEANIPIARSIAFDNCKTAFTLTGSVTGSSHPTRKLPSQ